MTPRDPEQIQREIEASRTDLASALDELVERVSPKRLAEQAKDTTVTWAQTPVGLAVVAGVALLVALGVARRARNRNR